MNWLRNVGISNMVKLSAPRLRGFWLDLAAVMTPDAREFAKRTPPQFANANCARNTRSYGYAFGHEPS
jgi:hypothetical protein